MNGLRLFHNEEFHLRITPIGDSFKVEAPGLARALAFRDAHRLVESIPDEEKGYTTACTPGGDQRIWHVTEPGFYRVLGQRQVSRIKDSTVRDQVTRFQDWVYRDVLPTIRRAGTYALKPVMAFEPVTYTWEEVAAELRQRYGMNYAVPELTRRLRAAGVLKVSGAPRRTYEPMFWWTGTHWELHRSAAGVLAYQLTHSARGLAARGFTQIGLDLADDDPPPQIDGDAA
ncbi:BRO-N domain-containing protein [Actinomadura rubrisoli]|uniref:Bro-N domain-containing protein n=1 Tax=Actinomadura rubrisoli TaxID=2530368 RepID=A0A4R5CCI1_9ACTN|nr:hypothetical protein [Actinomadura rubrisoli]TDD97701.1 hypothetical protein E1298_01305 [Actinomadura rubrisoli]